MKGVFTVKIDRFELEFWLNPLDGGAVVYAAILLTAAMFVGLVVSSLNWLERGGRKPVHA